MSRTRPTQVGRALSHPRIKSGGYSPEARGRSERAFRTLQDRLPKELGLAGITDLDAANRWLAEVCLPEHNARFAVAAEQDGSAFVADAAQAWREIPCIQEERQVGNDNTVKPNLNSGLGKVLRKQWLAPASPVVSTTFSG